MNIILTTRAILLLAGLMLLTGCGQGSYDKLVKQQISSLGTWQNFESAFGYSVRMPEGGEFVDETTDDGNSVTGSESKQSTWQSWFFRVESTRVKDSQIDLQAEANQLEQYYTGEGYEVVSRQDVQAGGLAGVDFRFQKPEGDALAVRLLELNGAAIRLTVSGATLDETVAQRFFGSVQRKPQQGGRRRA